MKQRMRLYDRLVYLSTVGNGVVPGVPLVELIADKRVLIENHMGVCRYTHEQICVKTTLGMIRVDGESLFLKKMTKDQLTIIGHIHGIIICGSDKNVV